MRISCILLLLLVAAGCARQSEHTATFAVTTLPPVGVSDTETVGRKVERMFESARFREIAFADNASLGKARVHLHIDQTGRHIEVSTLAAAEDVAFRAAQAYARAATEVLKVRRAEFEILSDAKVEVSSVSVPLSR